MHLVYDHVGERGQDSVASHKAAQEDAIGTKGEAGLGGNTALKPDLVTHRSSHLGKESGVLLKIEKKKTVTYLFASLCGHSLSNSDCS